ncbi:MAG: hypothetical protein PHE60_07605 [Sulfurospirillaceae bacterium]|nr:hypothetical protein [Sulfurospirillaceae bacterium]
MENNKFWEQYKAKCLEKGIAPLYANEEAFNKAMTEPPKPYSTDDLTPKMSTYNELAKQDIGDNFNVDILGLEYDINVQDLEDWEQVAKDANKRRKEDGVKKVEWKRCEHCNEMKEDTNFRRYRNGEYGKVCNVCIGSKISDGHKKNKMSTELKKHYTAEETEKVAIMELRVFHSALAMAYERGLSEGKSFNDLTVQEVDLPVILDDVLGA